ncbi:uncharacterized protein LOC124897803 [Capsicum annuum]|uniref:uncharacterized protein LOC124897803 n=1 Tax=Capsicum annuum TaxID=4072 RepID=UPI001FB16EFD|nr:uncharacterized protein LOC124897803 [Capsicum annuum]
MSVFSIVDVYYEEDQEVLIEEKFVVETFVEALISVLKRYKRAIGWTIADIISIPPGVYTHKIQLEEDYVSTTEHQRCLNPPMQEVVKKEIIKWIDTVVVYPISDSKWLSGTWSYSRTKEREFVLSDILCKQGPKSGSEEYMVIEQELLEVVYPFEKFRAYLLGTKEFDFEVKDHKGCENQVADHLSRLKGEQAVKDELEIDDSFPDKKALDAVLEKVPWYAEFANFVVIGGHHTGDRTARKVLQSGYYWPALFKDAYEFIKICYQCQRQGSISKFHDIPISKMLDVELFDVWGIDFMGPFMISFGMKYILVSIDYVSKWIEAVALADNEGRRVIAFLRRSIFYLFGVPRTIISDGGSYFCNKIFRAALAKYGVKQHKAAMPYHPKISG